MNARTLIVDTGDGLGRALLIAALASLEEAKPALVEELRKGHCEPDIDMRNRDLGFMEFFDWAATTSFEEQVAIWNDFNPTCQVDPKDAPKIYHTQRLRETFALATWQSL